MLALLALSVAPFQLPADGWVVFDQPAVSGTTRIGCDAGGESSLRDESGAGLWINGNEPSNRATHESVRIFVEYAKGSPAQVRIFTPDCIVSDAGIATRVTLDAAQAVKLLAGVIDAQHDLDVESHAVVALAHIAHVAADVALERMAVDGAQREGGNDALFWLAMRRGERGRRFVAEGVRPNWPLAHRERAVLALALSRHPDALRVVRETARNADASELRAQAVMGLGIVDAPNALADAHSIFLVDDSPAVREQAIFALSQLDSEEAARILADIIREPRFGEHRRTALFWLAQMNGARSKAVLDDLLSDVL